MIFLTVWDHLLDSLWLCQELNTFKNVKRCRDGMPECIQIRYMLQFWSSYIRLGSAWGDFINLVAYTYIPGSFFQTLPSCITLYVQIFHTCMVTMFADMWRDSVHKLECDYNQRPYHLAKTKLECMWSSAETRTPNHYKVTVRNFHAFIASRWFPHRRSDVFNVLWL